MKVLLITSGYNRVARKVISNTEIDVVGVAFTRQLNKKQSLKFRLAQFVYTIKDRFLRIIKTGKRLPIFYLYKDNQEEFVKWSKSLTTELTVVYSTPFIFIDEVVKSSPLGTINIHPSILPKYRGPQPLIWQYLNFDLNAGVTVHYLDDKEDTGDIICQDEFKIALGQPYKKTVRTCEAMGYELLIKAMQLIKDDAVERVKQPEKSPSNRAYRISKNAIFDRIEWNDWPVEHVYHLLQGMFTVPELAKYHPELKHQKDLVIKGYSNSAHYTADEVGKIIKDSRGFYLVCKTGLIQITQRVLNLYLVTMLFNAF